MEPTNKPKRKFSFRGLLLTLWCFVLIALLWAAPLLWCRIPDGNVIAAGNENYIERPGVTNILILGSDLRGAIENDMETLGGTGQADFVCLLSVDHFNKKVSVLSIPRDTLVEVQECDISGNPTKKVLEQLCLQYAYSTSSRQGCELMAERVSELLGGTAVDYYCAISLGVIEGIVDEFGGVDVAMSADYQVLEDTYPAGSVVHMYGEEAKIFLHYRDVDHYYTNLDRMARQKDFIRAFVPVAMAKIKQDPKMLKRLMDKYQNYVTYYLPTEEWPGLVWAALRYDINLDEAYVLPGEDTHQGRYDAYVVDEEAARSLILELYYQKMRKNP